MKKRTKTKRNKVNELIYAVAKLNEQQRHQLISRIVDAAAHYFSKCMFFAPLMSAQSELLGQLFAKSSPFVQFATLLDQELLSRDNTLSGFLYHESNTVGNDLSQLHERCSDLYNQVCDAVKSRQGHSGRDEDKHKQTITALELVRAGRTYAEIADEFGISTAALKKRISRYRLENVQESRGDK